jgi:GR25 family glycosyltransferase involved in LPS biosynthesis
MEKIDHFIYINLDKRADRKAHMEQEFANLGIPSEKITRISATYNPTNGIGCMDSHIQALKWARKMNYKNAWIFEDDFTFTADKPTIEDYLRQLFFKNPKFDVALASYIHKQPPFPPLQITLYPNIYRVVESQTASSYLVSGHYYNKLIDLFEDAYIQLQLTGEHWHYANDQVWKLLQVKDIWYCFTPSLGKQRPDARDNSSDANERIIQYSDQG